jgi:hypothetical protein
MRVGKKRRREPPTKKYRAPLQLIELLLLYHPLRQLSRENSRRGDFFRQEVQAARKEFLASYT